MSIIEMYSEAEILTELDTFKRFSMGSKRRKQTAIIIKEHSSARVTDEAMERFVLRKLPEP